MKTLKLAGCIALGFFLTACADMYYKVEAERAVDKNVPLLVANTKEGGDSVEERAFKRMLESALKKNGYTLLNDHNRSQKPCVLLFSLTEPTHDMVGSYTTSQTTYSTTSGWVGDTYVYGTSSSTTPQTHTYNYQVTFKKIYASVGCPNRSNQYDIIWDGFMSAELGDYENNKENAVSNLVELMEFSTFKGNLRIDTNRHVQHIKKHNKRKHYLTLSGDVAIAFSGVNFGKYYYTDGYGFTDTYDSTEFSLLSLPISLRAGYMYDTKKNMAFGLNALYQIENISGEADLWMNVAAKTQRVGLEATTLLWDSILVGVGVAKNIGSSAQINIDDFDYKAQFDKEVRATYGLWRLEYLYHFPATTLYLSTGLSGGWSLDDINYAGSIVAYSLGLFYKI